MANMRLSTVATLFLLCLVCPFTTAQHYPQNTALDGTRTTASPTTKSSSSGTVTSFFSRITGPMLAATSYTWSQYIIPITVGTVLVIVNEATNQTTSTTIFHTDYVRNGSTALLTRTDTNDAGTVTQVKSDFAQGQNFTVAYPTNYFVPAPSLTWNAVLPTLVNTTTCCFYTDTLSATPTHTPFVQIGPLDKEDDRGWLYTLKGIHGGEAYTRFNSTEVSSLFAGQQLSIKYDGCPYTFCALSISSVSPAEGVQARPGGILATSTTTISVPSEGETTSAEPSPTTAFTAIPDEDPTKGPETPKYTPSPRPPLQTTQPESTKLSGAPPQNIPESNTEPPQVANTSPRPGIGSTESTSSQVAATPPPGPAQSSSTISQAANSGIAIITIGSSTISANSASQFIVEYQTLAPGSSVTIGPGSSTTIVAIQTSGPNTVLVIGDSSSTLQVATASTNAAVTTADLSQTIKGNTTTGIGGIVCSMFGCDSTQTSSVLSQTGSAAPTSTKASGASGFHPSGVLISALFGMFCAALIRAT